MESNTKTKLAIYKAPDGETRLDVTVHDEHDATISKMETIVNRGFRDPSVEVIDHYNLDAILSVGYRVNSKLLK